MSNSSQLTLDAPPVLWVAIAPKIENLKKKPSLAERVASRRASSPANFTQPPASTTSQTNIHTRPLYGTNTPEFAIQTAEDLEAIVKGHSQNGLLINYVKAKDLKKFVEGLRSRGGFASEEADFDIYRFESSAKTKAFLSGLKMVLPNADQVFWLDGYKCYSMPLAQQFMLEGSSLYQALQSVHPCFKKFVAFKAGGMFVEGSVRTNQLDRKRKRSSDE